MNKTILPALILLAAAGTAVAQTIELAALGSLDLAFEPAVPVTVYPGQPVGGEVTFRQGEAFNVPSPGRVQQIEYLVEPGTPVAQGQPFAVLRGPEMHHLEMNYESSQALAATAERRFRSNKALYERKAISESQWLDISEQYYALMLEYEHMRHFFELVISPDEDQDSLTLGAPMAGLIVYDSAERGVEEGDSIAAFAPAGTVRLKVALPAAISGDVTAVRVGECRLPIERVSAMTEGFFVQAWTRPLQDSCPLMLGQQVLATPMIRSANTYRLPRSAVFQLAHENYVLVRSGDTLTAEAVELLGSEGDNYLLRASAGLDRADVLVASVSAVQGILLGLGGE
jgi:hypothetical protein